MYNFKNDIFINWGKTWKIGLQKAIFLSCLIGFSKNSFSYPKKSFILTNSAKNSGGKNDFQKGGGKK